MENGIKKSLLLFCALTALCGWLGVLTDSILTKQPKGSSLGMLLWLIIPLITAIIIRIFKKKDSKYLGLKPNFKGNLKWYAFSFLIFPLIALAVFSIAYACGSINLSKFNLTKASNAFFAVFLSYFFKNIFEELSWRGFLTERLINLKLSDITIYITAALVWSSWHIPYYLFLLPNVEGSRVKLLFIGILTLICWIIMFTELYRIVRSIWPCVILHAVINSLAVIYDYVTITASKTIIFNYDAGIISLLICIVIGLFMRRYRIKRELLKTKLL